MGPNPFPCTFFAILFQQLCLVDKLLILIGILFYGDRKIDKIENELKLSKAIFYSKTQQSTFIKLQTNKSNVLY